MRRSVQAPRVEGCVRVLSHLKSLFVSPERKPRRIVTGPFRGLVMNLSLETQSQLYLGLWERETYAELRRLSRGIATAVDIGTAQGEYTLYFLVKTGAAKVYAFEPDASCLPLLEANLKLNGMGQSERLELSAKFVGASDTEQQIRLDSLAESLRTPVLIKVDVDGGEEQILRGAERLNTLSGVRWLIETHSPELEAGCLRILKAAGYQTRIIRNAWWRIFVPELRPGELNRWLSAWKNE